VARGTRRRPRRRNSLAHGPSFIKDAVAHPFAGSFILPAKIRFTCVLVWRNLPSSVSRSGTPPINWLICIATAHAPTGLGRFGLFCGRRDLGIRNLEHEMATGRHLIYPTFFYFWFLILDWIMSKAPVRWLGDSSAGPNHLSLFHIAISAGSGAACACPSVERKQLWSKARQAGPLMYDDHDLGR